MFHMHVYYIDTDDLPGFFLLLKNHISIAGSEHTILSFTCEDIGVAMVTNMISQFSTGELPSQARGGFLLKFHSQNGFEVRRRYSYR